MQPYPVNVTHGKRHIGQVVVFAPDRRHAIALAVNTLRVRKNIPPQVTLMGVVR